MKEIMKLENMGYFGDTNCAIYEDEDEEKIYCVPDSQCKFPSCDAAQAGFGMSAFCSLYGFVLNKKDKITILKWWEFLNKMGFKEIAKFLENYLEIECAICKRKITRAYNLLHFSKNGFVCDECFNLHPTESDAILFK
jgi:hypothetical protein